MSGSDQSRMRRALSRMTGATQEQRLDALERALRKVGEAQRDQGAALSAAIADLADRVGHQPTAKDLQQVLQAVRALDSQIDRSIEDGLARGGPLERQRLAEKRLRTRLDQIAAGDGPIIVGPWSGEVGFEVLYWGPFVEWVRSQWGI